MAVRARDGDVRAKQKLARHNLAFVVAIARRQRLGSVRLDDVIQEGNVGLMRAIEKFDPNAGTRFSTYAVWWIRAYIGKYLKEVRSSVRPQSGTVAQSDLSLDVTFDEEGDVTHLERLEDDGPGPEDPYLSAEGDQEIRAALVKVRKRIGELGWDIIHNRLRAGRAAHARGHRQALGRVARARAPGGAQGQAVPAPLPDPRRARRGLDRGGHPRLPGARCPSRAAGSLRFGGRIVAREVQSRPPRRRRGGWSLGGTHGGGPGRPRGGRWAAGRTVRGDGPARGERGGRRVRRQDARAIRRGRRRGPRRRRSRRARGGSRRRGRRWSAEASLAAPPRRPLAGRPDRGAGAGGGAPRGREGPGAALGQLEAWRAEAYAAGRAEGLARGGDHGRRRGRSRPVAGRGAAARRSTWRWTWRAPPPWGASWSRRGGGRAAVGGGAGGGAGPAAGWRCGSTRPRRRRWAGRGRRWRPWPACPRSSSRPTRRSSRATRWWRPRRAWWTGGSPRGWRRCAGPWRRAVTAARASSSARSARAAAPVAEVPARGAGRGHRPARRPWPGPGTRAAPRWPGRSGGRAHAAHRPPHQAGGAGARGGAGRGPARRGRARWPGRRSGARSSPRWSALRPESAVLLPLGEPAGVGLGAEVGADRRPLLVGVGEGLLGRVLDGLGRTIDGPPPVGLAPWPVERRAPPPLARGRIRGAAAGRGAGLDGLLTLGRGQRIGLFAGAGVGKSSLLGRIARGAEADVMVVCLVGERGREVREFLEDALGPEGRARTRGGGGHQRRAAAGPAARGAGGDARWPSGSRRRGARSCSWSTR